jgi:hypothetical protein
VVLVLLLHLQHHIVEMVCVIMAKIVAPVRMTVLELHNVIIVKRPIGNVHPGLNVEQIVVILEPM